MHFKNTKKPDGKYPKGHLILCLFKIYKTLNRYNINMKSLALSLLRGPESLAMRQFEAILITGHLLD